MIVIFSSSSGRLSWEDLRVIAPVLGVMRMKGVSRDLDTHFSFWDIVQQGSKGNGSYLRYLKCFIDPIVVWAPLPG